MATRVADRLVLDTNVLIAATDEHRPEHDRALTALNDWPATGTTLYTSGQILREYLAVATRPVEQNGLGLPPDAALDNVEAFRGRLRVLAETVKVCDCLVELVDETGCAGKQIHDANIVATMVAHGVDTVVTRNVNDFARFETHVHVRDLIAA